MKAIRFISIIVAACFAALACNPDGKDSGSGETNANWWYNSDLAPKGVKSIAYDNYTDTYDKSGRIISSKSQYDETTYTYNSDGLPVSVVTKDIQDGEVVSTTTKTMEYKNSGKFCPIPISPGFVFHVFEMGLLPGLSKVTFGGDTEEPIVMEYKFSGSKLTISTSGTRTVFNESNEEVSVPYDDLVIEYSGAYPSKLDGEHEFIGPLTYQENGMFDTYVEGFYSWDEAHIVTMERTRTVSKSSKDRMLVEKEVSKYYNSPGGELYNTETIVYTYNEHGDEVSEVISNTSSGSFDYTSTFTYEYDSHGNWTKMTCTMSSADPYYETRTWTNERKIVYY